MLLIAILYKANWLWLYNGHTLHLKPKENYFRIAANICVINKRWGVGVWGIYTIFISIDLQDN